MIGLRKLGVVGLSTVTLLLAIGAGYSEARITIRPHAPNGEFFFHANYSLQPFDPSRDFTLEIWNCASGVMPMFLSDLDPLVLCLDAEGIGVSAAVLAYSVHVPGGSCVDHGRACYYRNRDFDPQQGGLRYFRVQYARPDRANRVWLQSSGDLSQANRASMLLLIAVDGFPRAVLEDTFSPLRNGGWFSNY